jgi:RHS repeat-associated protein
VTLDDPSAIGEKAWTFSTSTSVPWELALKIRYEDRPSAAQASSPLKCQDFTWVLDSAGNPYLGGVLTTLDPTGANVQTQTTQTLDSNGNVLTSNIYDYGNASTPARTYTNTYLTNSNYTSRYIFNRLLTSVVNNATQNVTLVTNAYDSSSLTDLPGIREHDSAYNTAFNYRGNLTSITPIGGALVSISRDIAGNTVTASDPVTTTSISTTSTTNYAAPSAITPNSNANLQTTALYTPWLSVNSMTGPNSSTASTTYDIYGRPSTSTSVYGAQTTYHYSGSGSLPYVIGVYTNNHWTQTTLDGFGRPLKVLRGTGSTTVSEVDTVYASCACSPIGKVQKVSQPYVPGNTVYWTMYTYDGLGRTVSVLKPDGASTTTYAYSGNTATVTDPAGKWKKQTSDAMGNLTQVNEPNPTGGADYVTSYTYDVMNHLTGVSIPRPAGTQTRTFVYDSNQRLQSETHPESGTKTYTYNADGTLATRVDAMNHKTIYTYDSYKRLTMKSYWYVYNGAWTEDTYQRLTLTYDTNPIDSTYSANAWGRLTTAQWNVVNCPPNTDCGVQTGTNTEEYSYTTAGQIAGKLLRVTRNTSALHYPTNLVSFDLTGTFAYDNEGHMTSAGYPVTYKLNSSNQPVAQPQLTYTYSYDAMERPYSVLDTVNSQTSPISVQYGPADEILQINYTSTLYDARTYNSLLQMTSMNGQDQSNHQYNYPSTGNNGRISSMSYVAGGGTVTASYSYDSLNRLVTASGNGWGTSVPAWSEAYNYDGFGNLTDKTPTGNAPALHIAVNGNNQIVGRNYDLNGNDKYYGHYDYENRLVGSSTSDTYAYGPDNLRVWKLRADGTEDIYFYDPAGRRLGVYQLVNYASGAFCVCGSQTSLWFVGENISESQDRLGSANLYPGYYPYGEEYIASLSDKDKFATYYRDGTTGLDYAMNRYYSSTLGRFLTPDPYFATASGANNPADPGSWNRYAYAENDPVNFNDPSGLMLGCPSGDWSNCGGSGGSGGSTFDPTLWNFVNYFSIPMPAGPIREPKYDYPECNKGDTLQEQKSLDYVVNHYDEAVAVGKAQGISAEAILGWGAYESGYGTNGRAQNNNNFFSEKPFSSTNPGWPGAIPCGPGAESAWACFGSFAGSATAALQGKYGDIIRNGLQSGSTNYADIFQSVAAAGYDAKYDPNFPHYGSTVASVIKGVTRREDCLKAAGYVP